MKKVIIISLSTTGVITALKYGISWWAMHTVAPKVSTISASELMDIVYFKYIAFTVVNFSGLIIAFILLKKYTGLIRVRTLLVILCIWMVSFVLEKGMPL